MYSLKISCSWDDHIVTIFLGYFSDHKRGLTQLSCVKLLLTAAVSILYTAFIVQAYQTSQYVVPRVCIFSVSGAALSQEVPMVK
jgi:hypothetical protein